MQVYLVGGAVRDALLQIPVKDRDWVVVGATHQQMVDLGMRQVGADFPVYIHPVNNEEYALARTERKTSVGYLGFEVNASPDVTLEQDLERRDLTINAMAMTHAAEIIDPYGGQTDLANRVLRHVSSAFVEDPLRVLRVARFKAQLAKFDFQLADETKALLCQMVASGELNDLTPERVWLEMSKALATDKPSVFFLALREIGALAELFPEVDRLFQVPQSPVHHPEGDAGTHTMMVVDAAAKLSDDLDIRFAALVHDLGKGVTDSNFWPRHPGHEQLGVGLVENLTKTYKAPKAAQQLAIRATRWHGVIHQGNSEMAPEDILEVLKRADALRQPEVFAKVLLVCEADHLGRLGFENHPYPQKDFWLGALAEIKKVDTKSLAESGLQGEKMAQAIKQQQLARLDNYLTLLSVNNKQLNQD